MRFVLPAVLPAFALLAPATVYGQERAHAVVLIVTDGLRWQELFGGADSLLISRSMGGVQDTAGLRRQYWRQSAPERRRLLMPFFWDSIAPRGAVWGNLAAGSDARVTNGLRFSYPGYNEMLTGWADPQIDKNDFGPNPHVTVFEWLHGRPGFNGRVAAFATWGVFNAIFNRDRAKFPMHAGWEPPPGRRVGTPERTIDRLYRTTIRLWDDNAYDALMQTVLLDHVRARKPRVLFVGYGETDEFAHARRYDLTLRAARRVDEFIAELWRTMQAIPEYRGRTTFIVTTDHGRGDGDTWTDHGRDVLPADQIWIAMFGAGVPAVGEVRTAVAVTQAQIAATVAALLGENFPKAAPRAAPPLIPFPR